MKKCNKKAGRWFDFDFDLPSGSTNSKLLEHGVINPKVKTRSIDFHACLTPKATEDLAVHSKKIAEVQTWLQQNVISGGGSLAKFLLITGPAGSGKTTTVRVLCKKLGINLTEWVNPVDHDFEVFRGLNQAGKFSEFLTESKWNSLFSTGIKKVVLVEEFPNVFIRNPEEFAVVLEDCFYKSNYPVIFIITDASDKGNNLGQKLFPDTVQMKYRIANISFNTCALTLMKMALKRATALVLENSDIFKLPSQSTVDAIMNTAMGDIRSAVNQYYMASLLGASSLVTTVKKPSNKRKRTESQSLPSIARDETLTLFHALGRVLNPKRTELGKLDCDVEKIIDEFSIQPTKFTNFLFENYLKYFGNDNDVFEAAELLSISQGFFDKWVDHQDTLVYALWVAVLGVMLANKHKLSRWNQIKGPKKVTKRVNNDPLTRHIPVTELYYYNVITKKTVSQLNNM